MSELDELGFDEYFCDQLYSGDHAYQPMRVFAVNRGVYQLRGEERAAKGQLSGRLEHMLLEPSDFPTVGDWVLTRTSGDDEAAVIERCLERRSSIVRKQAGRTSKTQIIAANVDAALIVQSCNHDLNLMRLERYLAAVTEGGVAPVLVLNKCDLVEDRQPILTKLAKFGVNVPQIFCSARSGEGLELLKSYVPVGKTAVLLGSSGVGKSTLINGICLHAEQDVQDIRRGDDKGRHTTTGRVMFQAKAGGWIIDTPGMREFGLTNLDIEQSVVFDQISALSKDCRYRDCQHVCEPGCAILAAVQSGELSEDKLTGLYKLRREAAFEQSRYDQRVRQDNKRRWKSITKQMRKHPKLTGK